MKIRDAEEQVRKETRDVPQERALALAAPSRWRGANEVGILETKEKPLDALGSSGSSRLLPSVIACRMRSDPGYCWSCCCCIACIVPQIRSPASRYILIASVWFG